MAEYFREEVQPVMDADIFFTLEQEELSRVMYTKHAGIFLQVLDMGGDGEKERHTTLKASQVIPVYKTLQNILK